MRMIDLTDEQVEQVEELLDAYDSCHMPQRPEGSISIGIEEDGKLIAGADACMTAFHILYVSTVYVQEAYRRKGYGKRLMQEVERRAAELGADTIRLDTFSFQGKEFYEAIGYKVVGRYVNEADGYEEFFFLKHI